MAFMAYFGYAMLTAMVLSPAITTTVKIDDINKSIDKAQTNYDDLKSKWQEVFKKQGELDQEMKTDIVNTFNLINDNIDQANKSHKIFQDENLKIQYVGVMIVFFTFFLLLMKHYDLFDTINEILLFPFKIFKKSN